MGSSSNSTASSIVGNLDGDSPRSPEAANDEEHANEDRVGGADGDPYREGYDEMMQYRNHPYNPARMRRMREVSWRTAYDDVSPYSTRASALAVPAGMGGNFSTLSSESDSDDPLFGDPSFSRNADNGGSSGGRPPLPPSAAASIGYESVQDYLNNSSGSGSGLTRRSLDGRWRSAMRERLDIRAGLRRDAERERRRLRRERDAVTRRRRYMADSAR